MNHTRPDRQKLREQILERRHSLTLAEQEEKSRRIVENILSLPETEQAETIFVYVNFRDEVRTTGFIKWCLTKGRMVSVPLTIVRPPGLLAVRITDPARDLTPGYCGIPEPLPELAARQSVDPATIDLVLVPGSVFDSRGGRLGYGGGFYDRYLCYQAPQAKRIGLAYELQLVDRVPVEPHDQLMDRVVTEERILTCRS
ncbi:5-formyltetrahydrofolate cyclo-ligase [Desulfolithobacter sp.]